MSGVVRGRFDVENLAAQLITDTAGYVAQQIQAKPVLAEYHQSQKASRGEGKITQTAIEQHWESQLINDAEFTANTPLPSVTFDVNNAYRPTTWTRCWRRSQSIPTCDSGKKFKWILARG